MAVTIHEEPYQYSFSDNPLTFVFSSNQTAQPNFSYIVETYFNGSLVSQDRVFPERTIYAHIDISPIVRNLLNKPVINNRIFSEAGISSEIKIKIIENYGTTPTNHSDTTSSIIRIVKGCLSDRDWTSYDPNDYDINVLGSKFMTNMNLIIDSGDYLYTDLNSPFVLQAIQGGGSETLTIDLYNSSGLIDSATETYSYYIAQININDYTLRIDCGFSALQIASAEWAVISIGNITLRLYFYSASCYEDPSTLLWINQFGSWDSFIFKHNIERKGEVTERTYTKKFGQWISNNFTYDLNDSGNVRVGTQQSDKLTIYTDWIDEIQQNYLTTLYISPRYFLYILGDQYNVRVTSNQFTFKNARFEDEISEAVELEIVNAHNSISL